MSLVDQTNRRIPLNLHRPAFYVQDGITHMLEAGLVVDVDGDSSFVPNSWVDISWSDEKHDSDTIRLTYAEADLLWQRLGLILGKTA